MQKVQILSPSLKIIFLIRERITSPDASRLAHFSNGEDIYILIPTINKEKICSTSHSS